MGIFDDDLPTSGPKPIAVGDTLDDESEETLRERIDALRAEIARTEEALKAKQAGRAAADAFFRTPLKGGDGR